MNVTAIIESILEEYALPWNGMHGIIHWGRVLENGLRLAKASGGDLEVVTLFALFHDSRRINEGRDPGHGSRGALLAEQFRGAHFELSDKSFELLQYACTWHTDEVNHEDITVQCCWDADRLDLGRVGMSPNRRFLNTAAAKSDDILNWAHGRAAMAFIPECVQSLCERIEVRAATTDVG
ncbi:MAG: hypothetical protein NT013_24605 [Planctomycetia bacterium]|nr:hypothetical protein [Planctomycetia bacterium]